MKVSVSRIYYSLPVLAVFGFPFVAALAPILGIASTPLSIFIRSLVIAFSLLILSRIKLKKRVSLEFLIFLSALLFWIIYFIRLSFFTLFQSEVIVFSPMHYWTWAAGASFLPMMAIFFSFNMIDFRRLFKFFFIFTMATLLLAVPNMTTEIVRDDVVVGGGRLQLESLNPISLGRLAACVVVLAVWFVVSNERYNQSRFYWLISIILIPFGVTIVIYTGSRGPLVSLVACLVLFIAASRAALSIKIILVLLFVAVIFLILTPFLDASLIYRALLRFTAAIGEGDMSTMSRLSSYQGAIEVFKDNPFWGGALEDPNTNFYPHNLFLEALMSTGIFGFAFVLCSMLSGIYASFVLLRKRSQSSWVGLLFVVFLTQANFSGSIYNSSELWVMLALTALGLKSKRVKDSDFARGCRKSR